MRQTPNDLKKRLMIKFDGEDGLDYGGLSRCVVFCAQRRGMTAEEYVVQRILLLAFARDV